MSDHNLIVFYNLSGCDAHLFIKKLRKMFNENDIGVIAEKREKHIRINFRIYVKLAGVINNDAEAGEQLGGERGRPPLPFFENRKQCPDFGKKFQIVSILVLKAHSQV